MNKTLVSMKYHSVRRKILYQISVFPFLGRNMYERLNSRLDRQIKIRAAKRLKLNLKKTRNLFAPDFSMHNKKQLFFDL